MIKKIKYINDSTDIFMGYYESGIAPETLLEKLNYDNDDSELKENEYYDFYDDEQGKYTYGQYEQAVAKDCVANLLNNIMQDGNDIIKDIQFVALHSPCEYNFSTDKLEVEITLDWDKLLVYIQENCGAFNEYLHDNYTSRSGFVSFVPNNYNEFFNCLQDDFERLSQVMIEFYILQCLDIESYNYDCIESADDLIWDYVRITTID